MKKSYSGIYPTIGEDQFDLRRALISMLNCRRYLEAHGFKDVMGGTHIEGGPLYGDGSCISYNDEIYLQDGSNISSYDFRKITDTKMRSDLIERIINESPILKVDHGEFDQAPPVLTTMSYDSDLDYKVIIFLSLVNAVDKQWDSLMKQREKTIEEEKSKLGIWGRLNYNPPDLVIPLRNLTSFNFKYIIFAIKTIITSQDIEILEKYKQGLEDAIKQNTLIKYTSQSSQERQADQIEVNTPQVKINFINPWEVQIPKLGGKKNE